jgi:hypothetical protein
MAQSLAQSVGWCWSRTGPAAARVTPLVTALWRGEFASSHRHLDLPLQAPAAEAEGGRARSAGGGQEKQPPPICGTGGGRGWGSAPLCRRGGTERSANGGQRLSKVRDRHHTKARQRVGRRPRYDTPGTPPTRRCGRRALPRDRAAGEKTDMKLAQCGTTPSGGTYWEASQAGTGWSCFSWWGSPGLW